MGRLDKYLADFTESERRVIEELLKKLKEQRWTELRTKKLYKNTYRLKHGRIRIIYDKLPNGKFKIQKIARRDDNTYREF